MARPKKPTPKRHARKWFEGTTREVRPGVYRAWRPRTATGSRPSRTFYGADAASRAAQWARGDPEPTQLYLGQWLERWLGLRAPRLRPMTRWNYARYFNLTGVALLDIPIDAPTADDFQRRANELLKVYSRADVVNWRGCISSAMRAAVARRLRSDNPLAEVGLPKAEERPVKAWSGAEVARLVDAARGSPHETWLWLSLGTGIRLGEARALTRSDVDVVGKVIRVSKSADQHTDAIGPTKTGKVRLVNIPDEVVPVLVAHLARLPASEPLLFRSTHRRGPFRAWTYQQWIGRLCKLAGVTVLPPHALRHTFATLALDNPNVTLKEVSEQLGHANVAITAAVYAHKVASRERRAAAALGAVLRQRPAGLERIGGA